MWRAGGTNATSTAGRSLEDEAAIRRVPSAPVERSWKVYGRPVRMSPRRAECFGTESAEARWKAELAQLEAVPGGVSIKRDTAVGGSTLKGNKAQESIGLGAVATQRSATDSDME